MIRVAHPRYTIELHDERRYRVGGESNERSYDTIVSPADFETHGTISCGCGVIVRDGDDECSAIVHGFEDFTLINEHTAIAKDDVLCIGYAGVVFGLLLPQLTSLWTHELKYPCCFGVHLPPQQNAVIVHGEMELELLDLSSGGRQWRFVGDDVLNGALELLSDRIRIEDFNGCISDVLLDSGRRISRTAGRKIY